MARKIKLKEKEDTAPEAVGDGSDVFNKEGELVVDVFETTADFVVLAAIAGIEIKNLDISIEKDLMVIKGNRQSPHNNQGHTFFYQECYWGPFSRKVVLPENINIESANAQMDKGLLTIRIPKNTGNAEVTSS